MLGFPCQEFKNLVLKHLLKTDVALYDIGTRLLGTPDAELGQRENPESVRSPPTSCGFILCHTNQASRGQFKFY